MTAFPLLGARVPRRGSAAVRTFGRLVLRLMGWRVAGEVPDSAKFVIALTGAIHKPSERRSTAYATTRPQIACDADDVMSSGCAPIRSSGYIFAIDAAVAGVNCVSPAANFECASARNPLS